MPVQSHRATWYNLGLHTARPTPSVACMQLDKVTQGQSCAFPRPDNARPDLYKSGCKAPNIQVSRLLM
jgi:hypothetical protein